MNCGTEHFSPELAVAKSFQEADPARRLGIIDALARRHPRNHWLRLHATLLCLRTGRTGEALRRLREISQSDNIGAAVLAACQTLITRRIGADPTYVEPVNFPANYYRLFPGKGFLPAWPELYAGRSCPAGFPFEMALPAIAGNKNDFSFILDASHHTKLRGPMPRLRIRIVAWLAGAEDLTALRDSVLRQTFPRELLRLSLFSEAALPGPDANFTWRMLPARPWRLGREEQIARFTADADVVLFLSGRLMLDPTALERMARYFALSPRLVVPIVPPDRPGGKTIGWLADSACHAAWNRESMPFRKVDTLNFAIKADHFHDRGGFEPRFEDPGYGTMEFCYRAYNSGSYFLPLAAECLDTGGLPLEESRESKRLFIDLCPSPWARKTDGRFEVPKISIYVPAYKAGKYIRDAVDSVLAQDMQDLEVCIADDGSPDDTLEVLERNYGSNPRVRWDSHRNGGIGWASNRAIGNAQGMYIGQLDSDDRLKPGAVRRLASVLDENPHVGCVYSSCERIGADGGFIQKEYNFPVFSREKMMITSIVHHFRMFRRQAWERTDKFREDIVNAVDYDMFLKLSEVSELQHIEEILYQRRWHGENTSDVHEPQQTRNSHVVQCLALERLGLAAFWDAHAPDPKQPRKVTYRRIGAAQRVFFWPNYSRANPYQRLLYSRSANRVEFIGGDIDVALKAAQDAADPENITFHLHWLNKIFNGAGSDGSATKAADEFIGKLCKLKGFGARIVWTLHNVYSHDLPFHDQENALSRVICGLADVLHVHSAASVPEIEQHFTLPREKVAISRHGSYCGFYPDFVTPETARKMLGLHAKDEVILFLGLIRPYKGVAQLIEAFRRILPDRPDALLLLAGRMDDDSFIDCTSPLGESERARIRLVDRFVDDLEMQLFFKSADMAVFPYRKILTSSSLLLALSFGVPVVIPDVGMTREVLQGTQAGLLYEGAGGAATLEATLRDMLARTDDGRLSDMALAAADLGRTLDWPDFAQTVLGDRPRGETGPRLPQRPLLATHDASARK